MPRLTLPCRRKAAYFSQATLDDLNTIDMIPGVGDVSVPPGWFKNARASKGRAGERPREESPPSWPESWTGVEVPTDPFRPQYAADAPIMGMQEENHPWGAAAAAPHGVNHANHHHLPVQEYYPVHTEYGRSHPYDQPMHYHPPPILPPPSAAAAVQPTRLPTLVDAGVDSYRDPSPFTSQSSSSASSDLGSSSVPTTPNRYGTPHLSAAPTPANASPQPPAAARGSHHRKLVPLAVLKTINPPVRDPMAEDCLRRLSNTPRGR